MPPQEPSALPLPEPVRIGNWVVRVASHARVRPETDRGASKQDLPEWQYLQAQGLALVPPALPEDLVRTVQESDILSACVQAMATNVGGHGMDIVQRIAIDKLPDAQKAEADAEKVWLERFFLYVSHQDSWLGLRRKWRWDLETTGNAFIEVIRRPSNPDEICGLEHLPATTVRLAPADRFLTDAIAYESAQDDLSWTEVVSPRYFRRFLQNRSGSPVVWYREFGDPRGVNSRTGSYVTKPTDIAEGDRATEIIHIRLYNPLSPYGLPRWYGAAYAAEGRRYTAIRNLGLTKNNTIPPIVIMVDGGVLGDGEAAHIREHFRAVMQTDGVPTEPLVLEAVPWRPDGSNPDSPIGNKAAIHIERLFDQQAKDGTFGEYTDRCERDVGMTFRLPPVLRGLSQDYTRATADTSIAVAEGQIFGPERAEEDWIINRRLLPAMKIRYWRVQTRGARLTQDSLPSLLGTCAQAGGITPNLARQIVAPVIGADMPAIAEPWGDLPFQLTQAMAAAGIDVTGQTEKPTPGQQVSAGALTARGLIALRDAITAEQKRRLRGGRRKRRTDK